MLLRIFRCNLPSSVLPAVASAAVPALPRRCFCRCSFCCFGWPCIVPVLLPLLFLSLFFLLPPAAPALFPWLFPPLFCRFLRRTSRAVPCALSRPGQHPDSPRSGHATRIGGYTKGRCNAILQRPRCRNVFVMPHPAGESCGDVDPGNLAGIVARKILRGCLCGVFCMGARDPRVVRLPGRAGLDVYRIRFRT